MRVLHIIPSLSLPDVVEAERWDKQQLKKLKAGSWQAYHAAAPAQVALGPRTPTYTEVFGDLTDESITLDRLQRQFRPSAAIVHWVTRYVQGASKEGSRGETTDFWLLRPTAADDHPVSPLCVSQFWDAP